MHSEKKGTPTIWKAGEKMVCVIEKYSVAAPPAPKHTLVLIPQYRWNPSFNLWFPVFCQWCTANTQEVSSWFWIRVGATLLFKNECNSGHGEITFFSTKSWCHKELNHVYYELTLVVIILSLVLVILLLSFYVELWPVGDTRCVTMVTTPLISPSFFFLTSSEFASVYKSA